MGYADFLKQMLKPLGVYDLTGGYASAELDAVGETFDAADTMLENALECAGLHSASDEVLTKLEELFPVLIFGSDEAQRLEAVREFYRVGDGYSSIAKLQRQLIACGFSAELTEGDEKFTADIFFDNVRGELNDQEAETVRNVMPAHIMLNLVCSGLTWDRAEELFSTWEDFESCGLTASEMMRLQ